MHVSPPSPGTGYFETFFHFSLARNSKKSAASRSVVKSLCCYQLNDRCRCHGLRAKFIAACLFGGNASQLFGGIFIADMVRPCGRKTAGERPSAPDAFTLAAPAAIGTCAIIEYL
jgi:hypothetical protein